MLVAFHKPYGVLSQFTNDGSSNRTLSEFQLPPGIYPLGRLDADSEGLLLLTDEAALNAQLLVPEHRHRRTYWVQVERIPSSEALHRLRTGVPIQRYTTLPAVVAILNPQPAITPREPPIRFRKNVPDCWLSLELVEGKNRQVRRMTAAIGHPTLRLIRVQIGNFPIGDLAAGSWKQLNPAERSAIFASGTR